MNKFIVKDVHGEKHTLFSDRFEVEGRELYFYRGTIVTGVFQNWSLFYQECAEHNEVIDKSIDDMEFSVRVANCLQAENIKTVRELLMWTERRLLLTPNLGRRSLNEIKEVLADYDLYLKPGY